jgi:hypothetical protein
MIARTVPNSGKAALKTVAKSPGRKSRPQRKVTSASTGKRTSKAVSARAERVVAAKVSKLVDRVIHQKPKPHPALVRGFLEFRELLHL